MAFLNDIPARTRAHVVDLSCPTIDETAFVDGPPLSERRVAVITSAAVHGRDAPRFLGGSTEFRPISNTIDRSDVLMSHISVNFDRTGFQQDINVVLPIDRLTELAERKVIGSVAATHYSCMGSTDPAMMEVEAAQVAGLLKADRVDAVLLVPV